MRDYAMAAGIFGELCEMEGTVTDQGFAGESATEPLTLDQPTPYWHPIEKTHNAQFSINFWAESSQRLQLKKKSDFSRSGKLSYRVKNHVQIYKAYPKTDRLRRAGALFYPALTASLRISGVSHLRGAFLRRIKSEERYGRRID